MRFVDHLYARAAHRDGLFFTGGWGDPAVRDLIADADAWRARPDPPSIQWVREAAGAGERLPAGWSIRRGKFASPFPAGLLPAESRTAWIEVIGPAAGGVPAVIHFAATGDQGFGRRRAWMAEPLARAGIASVVLENPFYGRRRPPGQPAHRLLHVADLLAMGAATVLEGVSLLAWLRAEGFGPLGVAGVSMGGSMAAMTGALGSDVLDLPIAVAGCLAAHSPEAVFVDGLLSRYCDWNRLSAGTEDARALFREWVAPCDIRRFPRPSAPDRAILLGARSDAYVPAGSIRTLHAAWPGSRLEWLRGGHVVSAIFGTGSLRSAIERGLAK